MSILGCGYARNHNELIVTVTICVYSSMRGSSNISCYNQHNTQNGSFKMRCLVGLQKILHTVRIISMCTDNSAIAKHTRTTMHNLTCKKILHWTISHQASLWSTVTLRVLVSSTCWWKEGLVQVRVHDPVWKIFIDIVTSLSVQVSCLVLYSNLSATRAK